jgi:hypothetical protein
VILLENSNEWNLPSKRMILKKREEQELKSKRGETSIEKLHVFLKKEERMGFISCWERFYQ